MASIKQPILSSTTTPSMLSSPRTRGERDSASLSPIENPAWCKFSTTILTPPPVSLNSESFFKIPSSSKLRGTSSTSSDRVLFEELLSAQLELEGVPEDEFFLVAPKQVEPVEALLVSSSPKIQGTLSKSSSSCHRVLSEELLSAQLDLENVPEDEFFLAAPEQVDPVEPLLVRPRPCRSSDDHLQETPSVTSALSRFRSIIDEEEQVEVGVDYDSAVVFGDASPQPKMPLRLKPRPASIHYGQHTWNCICTLALGDSGNVFLA
jgi:hypothetical protein